MCFSNATIIPKKSTVACPLLNGLKEPKLRLWSGLVKVWSLELPDDKYFFTVLCASVLLWFCALTGPYRLLLAESMACLLSCRSPELQRLPRSHWIGWGSWPPSAPPLWAGCWAGWWKKRQMTKYFAAEIKFHNYALISSERKPPS